MASSAFVLVGNVAVARFGQGVAAAALSPAASPLLGGVLIHLGDFDLLFLTMAALAAVVAGCLAVPELEPLPRQRQTVRGLVKRLSRSDFLRPTAALAASTAALVQPRIGKALNAGRVSTRAGTRAGLLAAAGFVAAVVPGLAGALVAAVLVGAGSGAVAPLAFAALARSTPEERTGQTMGSAEVGRELGDAGGPLLVGGLAVVASLPVGLLGLAAVIALTAW
ncbi:hypothetical protein V1227_39300 [Lentzea sp. DG1S-22]|uniref:hypothetical protein n=1 Tax=Lentzea sp. DG1S-22 TaxID=3108822 RepID=UPI002E7604A7|nr:hypothetical protein [Lentzea sp. DG1S-22]WVH80960.1 hypothetical protein V1227_39300 [Lentzea sp. DG1S-22]